MYHCKKCNIDIKLRNKTKHENSQNHRSILTSNQDNSVELINSNKVNEIKPNPSKEAILEVQESTKNENEVLRSKIEYKKELISDLNTLSKEELVEMLIFFMKD